MTERPMSDRPGTYRHAASLLLALVVVLVLGAGLVGCGSSGSSKGSADTAAPDTTAGFGPAVDAAGPDVTVKAIDNDFTPKNIVVAAGTKVTFDNTGHNFHDVVPVDKAKFDFTIAQEKFAPGAEATFTFTKPGTYTYYCSLHATATAGDMRGQITVK